MWGLGEGVVILPHQASEHVWMQWWKQCRMKLAKEQGDGSPVLGEASQASEVGKITCLGKYAGKSLLLLHSKKVSWKQGCSGWGKRLCAKHISIHLSLATSFSLFEKLHCYFFSKQNLFVCLFFLWSFLRISYYSHDLDPVLLLPACHSVTIAQTR